jgi:hypothetical protein
MEVQTDLYPEKENETFDPSTVVIGDTLLDHVDKKMRILVPIKNSKAQSYYVMTDVLPPNSVFCGKEKIERNGKLSYRDFFDLKKAYKKTKKTQHTAINKMSNDHHNEDVIDDDNVEVTDDQIEQSDDEINNVDKNDQDQLNQIPDSRDILLQNINAFRKGITDRIRYIVKIPEYKDSNVYGLHPSTIKLNDKILYKNIIQFQNKKNNFDFYTVRDVLRLCRCKLLLRVSHFTVTDTNVYVYIRLVRIYPESLDELQSKTKLKVLSELNSQHSKNFEKYNMLSEMKQVKYTPKTVVKTELKKILKL